MVPIAVIKSKPLPGTGRPPGKSQNKTVSRLRVRPLLLRLGKSVPRRVGTDVDSAPSGGGRREPRRRMPRLFPAPKPSPRSEQRKMPVGGLLPARPNASRATHVKYSISGVITNSY